MLFKTISAAVFGIDAYVVDVEIDLTPRGGDSLSAVFTMVGLPDPAVRESRERIRAAINNCDFIFPIHRVTVNLAPADIKKEGSSFALPIGVAARAHGVKRLVVPEENAHEAAVVNGLDVYPVSTLRSVVELLTSN